eukprot:6481886-Amphidinium_carterae.1
MEFLRKAAPDVSYMTNSAKAVRCSALQGTQTHQGQGGVHEGPTYTHSSSTLTHIHTQQPVVAVVRCLAWNASLTTPPLVMSTLDRINGSHLDVRLESLSGAPDTSFLARLECDGDLSRMHLLQRLCRKHREQEEEHACRRRAEFKRASRVCASYARSLLAGRLLRSRWHCCSTITFCYFLRNEFIQH